MYKTNIKTNTFTCIKHFIKYSFVIVVFLFANQALAQQSFIIEPQSLTDVKNVTEPEQLRNYYGELKNFPHTYEIREDKEFLLSVKLFGIKGEPEYKDLRVLIIRESDSGRGVDEVSRLSAKNNEWDSVFVGSEGESYFVGPEFESIVKSGVYRIEVSTPVNKGKYKLSVGKKENLTKSGYLSSLSDVYKIKIFLGKSPISILESQLVYIPLIIILLLIIFLRKIYKKNG